MEVILGGILLALVGAISGKVISDRKLVQVSNRLYQLELIMVRVEEVLKEINDIKHDTDVLFDRLRLSETRVTVLEAHIDVCPIKRQLHEITNN
jgi:hypothetical protein